MKIMTITFQNKAGKTLTGEVTWTGHYDADKPKSHRVTVKDFPHVVFWIPVSEVMA